MPTSAHRDQGAERGETGRRAPGNVEDVAARRAHVSAERPGGADRAGEQTEAAVLQREHRRRASACSRRASAGSPPRRRAGTSSSRRRPPRIRMPLTSAMAPTIEIASVTLSTTVLMLARTSRTSMADTLGNCATRSRWKRPRSAGSSGAFRIADPGLRRLVERAGPEDEHEPAAARVLPLALRARSRRAPRRCRPATSKRMMSPTSILNRSWMLFSIETSAGRRVSVSAAARPERAVDHRLVRLEVIAVGDRVLAPERARAAGRPRTTRGSTSRPLTPVTRARITGMSCGGPTAWRLARVEKRPHRLDLRRQDLDQEHVGAARAELERRTAAAGSPAASGRR